MKLKKIIYPVLVIAILGMVIMLVMNTDKFRKWRLAKQLSDKYSVVFFPGPDEQDLVFFSPEHVYMLTSDEGIRSYAKCDWKGKLIADSYANYFYADELIRDVENLIEPCFDECYVVRDCIEYGSNQCLTEFVGTEDSRSFEAYSRRKPEVTVTYRVYVDYFVSSAQLQNALDILSGQDADYSVYFLRISPAAYEIIRDAGLKCYYPHSGVVDVYRTELKEGHLYPIHDVDFESIVYEPFDVTVADYIPKYGESEIYEDFYERNLEYFINVDREHTFEEIVSDIGYENGVTGSGIFTFIWKLNDGEAHLVFDSSGHIITINIFDEENNTHEMIYSRY